MEKAITRRFYYALDGVVEGVAGGGREGGFWPFKKEKTNDHHNMHIYIYIYRNM